MSPIITPTDNSSSGGYESEVHLMKRASPKIGGSVAGFIVVVVVLVVIIIAAGSAVIYLIRENATSLKTRRPRSGRYPNRPTPGIYSGRAENPGSWFSRLRELLGVRKPNESMRNPDRKGVPIDISNDDGWMPAHSGGEWLYPADESPTSSEGVRPEAPRRTTSPSAQPRSILSGVSIPSSRHSIVSSDSSLNVRFELQGIRGISYPDRFSPSPQPTLPSIHTQLSSPSSSTSSPQFPVPTGLRTTSPEPTPDLPPHASGQGRQYSTQSGHSIVTFEGGTKFVEGL